MVQSRRQQDEVNREAIWADALSAALAESIRQSAKAHLMDRIDMPSRVLNMTSWLAAGAAPNILSYGGVPSVIGCVVGAYVTATGLNEVIVKKDIDTPLRELLSEHRWSLVPGRVST